MRHAITMSLLILLAACSGLVKKSDDGGVISGNGGNSGNCQTCGDALVEGKGALCSGSSALYTALQGCACDPNKCQLDCSADICLDGPMSSACGLCLQTKCAGFRANCGNDASN